MATLEHHGMCGRLVRDDALRKVVIAVVYAGECTLGKKPFIQLLKITSTQTVLRVVVAMTKGHFDEIDGLRISYLTVLLYEPREGIKRIVMNVFPCPNYLSPLAASESAKRSA